MQEVNDNYLDNLNPQQRAAVEYCEGPELVIAGAGSGKTRVLTYKIVHLLKCGIHPYRILALTFTNKAAREMRERIEKLVGSDVANQLWMGTFHSIFARILRRHADAIGYRHDYTIYDTSDSLSLIKRIIKDMELDDKVYKPSLVQSHISRVKNSLISPENYLMNNDLMKADEVHNRQQMVHIYQAYWSRCRLANAMDFDDLLFMMNVLLRDNKDVLNQYREFFKYILVDEYQDTNFAQHLIISQLAPPGYHVCVVGDDAQSIYSFRGANISNVLHLEQSFTNLKTFKLEQNYRSTQTITLAANSLISKNKGQIKKSLFSNNEQGRKIDVIECASDISESYVVANQITAMKVRQGDSYEDFAILYRTNAQSRRLEEAMSSGGKRDTHGNKQLGIPYRIYGGLSFYQRKEVKDTIAYFRLSVNPNDDEALRRVVNYPSRGIGETTMGKIQHAAVTGGVSIWTVLTHIEQYELSINKRTIEKLNGFVNLIRSFINLNEKGLQANEVARQIITDTGLIEVLTGDKSNENISRIENINELHSAVNDYIQTQQELGNPYLSMSDFLTQASLATDQDSDDDNEQRVTLMTVHAAKGLEFKNVIIVGVEEDLFPSAMSRDDASQLEEERRLLYVAITRAKQNCVITYARERFRNGSVLQTNASRFISDIDPQYLNVHSGSLLKVNNETAYNHRFKQSSWQHSQEQPKRFTPQSERSETTSIDFSRFKPLKSVEKVAVEGTSQSKSSLSRTDSTRFSNHSAGELKTGDIINHERFGRGVIVEIDTSGASDKISVEFDEVGRKNVLLKYARFMLIDN